MYNHEHQYRCTIIRGKSQKEMDDLLPAYAKVIDEICPCDENNFETLFNNAFKRFLPESERIKKTLDNHRTEISGKLFGMYYFALDGKVYISERTQKYLEDNDQPAFFKDICYKMQFPNGSQKITTTVVDRINNKISIRPNSFVLKLLLIAQTAKIDISKKEIGYYVLNALDVLQGIATPYEVLEAIVKDQKEHVERDIINDKASSYNWQHIKEQLNYLELANLIRYTDDKKVILNPNEMSIIELFADDWDKPPIFDVYSYSLGTVDERKSFQYDWDYYFSKLSLNAIEFETKASSLIVDTATSSDNKDTKSNAPASKHGNTNLVELGDEGEQYVFEYEKKRVANFNPRLVSKVLALGKQRGLGYDIQSVIAEPGNMSEFVKYIEVKSTKRLTCPNVDDTFWIDTLNVTRNEWIAAQQHGEFYSIYRVFFTREGVTVFVLDNPYKKYENGNIQAVPMTYRIDFGNTSIDRILNIEIQKGGN